ncbi:MAG: Uma2 family endonuclease [Planctomycetia bacterium]|nr:Uma2 family endonuclease [Planctomycetia bacterium]
MSSPTETSTPAGVPTSPHGNGARAALPPEVVPDLEALVIEDDTPVDSIFAEKQQRLLAEALYASWAGPGPNRTFQAFANVGLFFNPSEDPLAPDNMLAIDIPVGGDLALRRNRSYFVWERGKPPDVAIEIVSDRRGREEDFKLETYARIGVPYYVIFDPLDRLHHGVLRCFANQAGEYQPLAEAWFPRIGLGLMLWDGEYEGHRARWLRWYDAQRRVIAAGPELAVQARQLLDQERQRAEQAQQQAEQAQQQAEQAQQQAEHERQRAEQERQRAEQLAAKLRALGIDPQQP